MNEETRQKWIGIVMDLLVEYYAVCDEPQGSSAFLRPMCDRIADAVGDGATGEFGNYSSSAYVMNGCDDVHR